MRSSHTTVSHQNWFQRMGNALCGVLVGLFLFAGSFPLLVWNEGVAVNTARSLDEGQALTIAVAPDYVNPANVDKLVHVCAPTHLDELIDREFGITAPGVILKRNVEMYQYVEHKSSRKRKTMGGGEETVTTYSYSPEWRSGQVDSSRFHDRSYSNPHLPVSAEAKVARDVNIGAFRVDTDLVQQLTETSPVDVSDPRFSAIAALEASDSEPRRAIGNGQARHQVGKANSQIQLSDRMLTLVNGMSSLAKRARVDGKALYIGSGHLGLPVVGDVRVTYDAVVPETLCSVARQSPSGVLSAYTTSNGYTIGMLESGHYSISEMFAHAHTANAVRTWLFRAGGAILMAVGLSLLFGPLQVAPEVIPIVGGLMSWIVSAGVSLVVITLTFILSLTTIAIAWFAYRPLLSCGLVALAAAGAYLVSKLRKSSSSARSNSDVNSVNNANVSNNLHTNSKVLFNDREKSE